MIKAGKQVVERVPVCSVEQWRGGKSSSVPDVQAMQREGVVCAQKQRAVRYDSTRLLLLLSAARLR